MPDIVRRAVVTAVFLSALATFTAFAQEQPLPMRAVSQESLPFAAGEKITYKAHYRWAAINTDVARGYLTLDSAAYAGAPAYACRLYGVTSKFYDRIFKVREDFRAHLRCSDLLPQVYSREAHEGNYYATDEYRYDWGGRVIAARTDSKTKGKRNLDLPLDDCTMDFLSQIYRIRNVDLGLLQKGKAYSYTLPLGNKVSRTHIIYRGREVKYVKGIGNVRSLKFVLQLMDNEQFNDGTEMAMWLSDDDNRVIIALETPIKVGRVKARIESYEGLKYPFSALLQP